ncbi:hypothetical protein PR048_005657 [Dryococelus australis]|uniref:Uncharacterized protein n=1 Tax=Dryococelus australis TaxID=614101 RepID=A0ABQ9I8V1_9NEOP|nr:hypothetical protein PR048_005657 [Dryococelus australis]
MAARGSVDPTGCQEHFTQLIRRAVQLRRDFFRGDSLQPHRGTTIHSRESCDRQLKILFTSASHYGQLAASRNHDADANSNKFTPVTTGNEANERESVVADFCWEHSSEVSPQSRWRHSDEITRWWAYLCCDWLREVLVTGLACCEMFHIVACLPAGEWWWGGKFFASKWVELVERDDRNIGLVVLWEGGKTSGARPFSANRMLISYHGGDRGDVVVKFLTSHQGEAGSIPSAVAPIITRGNRAGCRWSAGFLGGLPFFIIPAPYSPPFTLRVEVVVVWSPRGSPGRRGAIHGGEEFKMNTSSRGQAAQHRGEDYGGVVRGRAAAWRGRRQPRPWSIPHNKATIIYSLTRIPGHPARVRDVRACVGCMSNGGRPRDLQLASRLEPGVVSSCSAFVTDLSLRRLLITTGHPRPLRCAEDGNASGKSIAARRRGGVFQFSSDGGQERLGENSSVRAHYLPQRVHGPEGGTGMKGRGKREIPEKTRRPTASSGTIPTCENPVTRQGIEPSSPWWEASVLIAQPPMDSELRLLTTPSSVLSNVAGVPALESRRPNQCATMHKTTTEQARIQLRKELEVPSMTNHTFTARISKRVKGAECACQGCAQVRRRQVGELISSDLSATRPRGLGGRSECERGPRGLPTNTSSRPVGGSSHCDCISALEGGMGVEWCVYLLQPPPGGVQTLPLPATSGAYEMQPGKINWVNSVTALSRHTTKMDCEYVDLHLTSTIMESRPASLLTGRRQCRFCDRFLPIVKMLVNMRERPVRRVLFAR